MTRFVKAQRDRFNHHLFRSEKFCRGYAWDWIVAHAAFREIIVDVSGRSVRLQRGQLCYSVRYLAAAWNWDKAAVSRFIARLKTEAMIETQTETGQTIITVCNYEKYQTGQDGPETGPETAPETGARQQRDSSETNKEKEEKEEKILGAYAPNRAPPAKRDPSAVDALSEVVGKDAAKAFKAHRDRLRKPMTPRAGELIAKKLAKLPDPVAAIEMAIERGWQGIEEDWLPPHLQSQNGTQVNGGRQHDRTSRSQAKLGAWLEGAERRE